MKFYKYMILSFLFFSIELAVFMKEDLRYVNEILELGTSARAMALGGAYVALSDDIDAFYWNPAGLMHIKNIEFSSMHSTLFNQGNYDTFSLAKHFKTFGSICINWTRLSIDDMPISSDWNDPQTDPYPTVNQTKVLDNVLTLSFGEKTSEYFSFGVTVKGIWKDYPTKDYSNKVKAEGISIDSGILCCFKNINLGLSTQNIFNGLTWHWPNTDKEVIESYSEKKKINFKAGVVIKKSFPTISGKGILLADVDTSKGDLEGLREQIGIEYWIKELIALRTGYVYMPKTKEWDLTFGTGFNLKFKEMLFKINYAFIPHSLSYIHYVSMGIKL